MTSAEHVAMAEECLARAAEEADRFKFLCETVPHLPSDLAALQVATIQVNLAEAQVHATLALVKR